MFAGSYKHNWPKFGAYPLNILIYQVCYGSLSLWATPRNVIGLNLTFSLFCHDSTSMNVIGRNDIRDTFLFVLTQKFKEMFNLLQNY